ncbi:helix-turn-helix domain-containing protein [Streptomyces sp. H27-C3]|uniref:helix-turn-helix domain-containing protein n=1 Tax=Streptomyces sp. H27-C3 TaxID=3046305 RepID=UPI0024B98DCF|nr:helix-turn-helix domain-containing protein [Streptomyces sp. H27-C3]MDJ0460653.1 helix-turn-helix domain-containing protein [Streptomyces sp. H27-C3]
MGTLTHVKNQENPHPEDFAQLLARLMDEYNLSGSEIARRIGVSVSTVNTWVHRKRTPRDDALRAIAREYPKFSEADLFAAVERKAPGPLSPDREARILELIRGLTAEQQEMKEIELRALNDANRS